MVEGSYNDCSQWETKPKNYVLDVKVVARHPHHNDGHPCCKLPLPDQNTSVTMSFFTLSFVFYILVLTAI